MKNRYRLLFWGIIFLTITALLVDLPSFTISFESPQIPFINKRFSINRHFEGDMIRFFAGSFNFHRDTSFRLGLDLAGGTSVTLKAKMEGASSSQKDAALDGAKSVIERRVNLFGVSEPVVQTAKTNNEYRIIVELPGITDVDEAVRLIGTTAQLSFWEQGSTESGKLATASALPKNLLLVLPNNPQKTNLTGSDLEQASVTFSQNTAEPQVQLVFKKDGIKKFADITKRNTGKVLAIVLDDQLLQAPQVNEPILGGNAVITGGFTAQQAKTLSIQLNGGALPVSLSILEQRTIGATLGSSSLAQSLFAGAVGFVVIVIFMIVLYGRLGVIASFTLILYALFVLALFKLIPITLTLAGISGFILSIGMAVDANILIFERMKEEFHRGKHPQVAMELGFSRAWTSIRDSNVSSIITALILFYFGTGAVKGFALTLCIGVLVSMFSAITITKTFLRLIYKNN